MLACLWVRLVYFFKAGVCFLISKARLCSFPNKALKPSSPPSAVLCPPSASSLWGRGCGDTVLGAGTLVRPPGAGNRLIWTKTKYKTEADFLFLPLARIAAAVARGWCGAAFRGGQGHPRVLASAAGTGPAGGGSAGACGAGERRRGWVRGRRGAALLALEGPWGWLAVSSINTNR